LQSTLGPVSPVDACFAAQPAKRYVFTGHVNSHAFFFGEHFLREESELPVFVKFVQDLGGFFIDQSFDHLRDVASEMKRQPLYTSFCRNANEATNALVLPSQP
jgi:hypothetical protein